MGKERQLCIKKAINITYCAETGGPSGAGTVLQTFIHEGV